MVIIKRWIWCKEVRSKRISRNRCLISSSEIQYQISLLQSQDSIKGIISNNHNLWNIHKKDILRIGISNLEQKWTQVNSTLTLLHMPKERPNISQTFNWSRKSLKKLRRNSMIPIDSQRSTSELYQSRSWTQRIIKGWTSLSWIRFHMQGRDHSYKRRKFQKELKVGFNKRWAIRGDKIYRVWFQYESIKLN